MLHLKRQNTELNPSRVPGRIVFLAADHRSATFEPCGVNMTAGCSYITRERERCRTLLAHQVLHLLLSPFFSAVQEFL